MISSEFFKDRELLDEIQSQAESLDSTESAPVKKFINYAVDRSIESALNIFTDEYGSEQTFVTESVIKAQGRPAILIQNQTYQTPRSQVWKNRLEVSRNKLEQAISAVGRIEIQNHYQNNDDVVGTGWLISNDIIVTNKHVAENFAETTSNDGFTFKQGPYGTIRAVMDFREEHRLDDELEFFVEKILFMEKNNWNVPDIAFLKIRTFGIDETGKPINLSVTPLTLATDDEVKTAEFVATIGYPGDYRDSESLLGTSITLEHLRNIFRSRYRKCLMPGKLIKNLDSPFNFQVMCHDCSTLPGCSGSPVIDLKTGKVLGLHFGGINGDRNFAVHVHVIREYIARIL